ncbi:MAG: SH3 domain-containing protein [Planctomycetota bacterium]|nr:SH3 domain-containing protein [Planctomycetota bacterium]
MPAASESVPPVAENPRPGKVSGGRVNVRAGPNTQYESVAVLTTGNPVTVLARHGEWYKIVFPADQLVSIHKNYVDAEITGDIPEAGVPGVVNQDKADVHAFYWDRSTMVGQLNKGDPVVIRQERGQWYRINAPDNARAYIFAEYVRVDGGREVAADSAPPPNNPAIDLSQGQPDATGRLKLSENDRRAAALKESYFKRVREQQLREEETVNRAAERVFSELEELERKIKEIDSEVASQIYAPAIATDLGSAAWAPPDPVYGGYTGWIENIGRMGGAPTSFRLSKGGEIRFHLRSEHFSLADFSGRRVWLNGGIEPSAGGNILNVEQIRPLSDQEILDSMRQTLPPLADGGGAAGYADSGGSGFPGQFPASPVIPSDPALLPDVVGVGQPGSSQYSPARAGLGSGGEVESDYYENPIVSDVAP